MSWLITKFLITAGVIVLISEVAKYNDKAGALIGALPTVTILALIWMHIEGQAADKLSKHAFYTFWYVIPSLPMLLLFPYLYTRLSLWLSLAACVLLTIVCFLIIIGITKLFGINLV